MTMTKPFFTICFQVFLHHLLYRTAIAGPAETLLSIKSAWLDPGGRLSNWSNHSSTNHCSWYGVSCAPNSSKVISLNLSRVLISGTLSPTIAELGSSLKTLLLSEANLSGPIPHTIGALSSISQLDLSFNNFSGELPRSIASSLPSLQELNLGYNLLSGQLPDSWISNSSLHKIYLNSNNFSGYIPSAFSIAPSLQYLLLDHNGFNGSLPSNLSRLSNLLYFSFSHNKLSGSLPSSIVNLSRLVALYGGFNSLSGSIPSEISSLRRLSKLDLQHNNFTGSIPASFVDMTNLSTLNLSNNNLSGQVPANLLDKFGNISFAGNVYLCLNVTCSTPKLTPPPEIEPFNPQSTQNGTNDKNNNGVSSGMSTKAKTIIGVLVSLGVLLIIFICLVVIFCKTGNRKDSANIECSALSPSQTRLSSDAVKQDRFYMFMKAFKYTYEDVVSHAGYYDTAHVIGKGRFATVYRSDIPGGSQLAVKVFSCTVSQSVFEKEIIGLEQVARFYTLLPIRGFYSSHAERAIFYDFMAMGNLYDMLHTNTEVGSQLDWSRRLTIATGVAQAIAHLHRGSSLRILHKDLKSSNVLLDNDFFPYVSDYGLIGLVSKAVVETPGYLPPELKTSKKYTERTDVYCFGVILLELLTGKKPVSFIGSRELNLVNWVVRLYKDGRGTEVFSSYLVQTCPFPDYPDRALNLAILCVSEQPAQRPTMSEIASILEGLGGSSSPLRSPRVRQDRPLLM